MSRSRKNGWEKNVNEKGKCGKVPDDANPNHQQRMKHLEKKLEMRAARIKSQVEVLNEMIKRRMTTAKEKEFMQLLEAEHAKKQTLGT